MIFASHNNNAYSVMASDGVSITSTNNHIVPEKRSNHDFQEVGLTAYPNPFKNSATVNFNLATKSEYQVILYDMKGSLVGILKNELAEAGKLVSIEVDGSALTAGLYIIKLQTPTKTSTLKLMLSR